MESRSGKTLVRFVLMAFVVLAGAGAAWLGVSGQLGWARVGALLALAVASVRTLPGGARVAGWLFALFVGLGLILVGTSGPVIEQLPWARIQVAVGGGAVFLLLSVTGLWACSPDDGNGRG